MTLPMDKEIDARPIPQRNPDIADLARGANGLGEAAEIEGAPDPVHMPMAGLVTAGFWNMAALSLAGMSIAATTAARVWSLGAGVRDDEKDL